MNKKIFYRYEDNWGQWSYDNVKEIKLYLIKETPCGYWISMPHLHYGPGRKRWVSKTTRKRYAYPTREEALEGYKARKRRHIAILQGRLQHAQDALNSCDYFVNKLIEKENKKQAKGGANDDWGNGAHRRVQ